ncbi:MAG: DctP family TRAP transporter solute-binding subunit [Clostridiales bacterium]|nr:DctP family TRAP transporter solute-binding subunit [Clostridiales bacterium]
MQKTLWKLLSLTLVILMTLSVVVSSASAEPITLRLGHTQPAEHMINISAMAFADMVKEKTNGEVVIDVYPTETLGTNTELSEACSRGDVDFYVSATGQYTQRYAPFTIVEAFYMFRDQEHMFKFYQSAAHDKLVEGLAQACSVHILADLYYGARQMTTSGKPLNTADDLNGLKMRAANEPLPIAAFTQLGAVPTPIAYNETYLALQQHTVDGQENPPASIYAMKFFEVQDYLNLTYHQFQMLSIFMSDAAMKKLSQEQIDIVYECARAVAAEHNPKAVELEQGFIEQIGQTCQIIQPDIESFRQKIAPMYDQFKDKWLEGMYEEIQAM